MKPKFIEKIQVFNGNHSKFSQLNTFYRVIFKKVCLYFEIKT